MGHINYENFIEAIIEIRKEKKTKIMNIIKVSVPVNISESWK